jgi:lipoate-protein ligase A
MSDSFIPLDYDLPDAALIRKDSKSDCQQHLAWIPDRTIIVIGNGSDPDTELHLDRLKTDEIPVYRRNSGGCAVLLTPDMFVCSFALYGEGMRDSVGYFSRFNAIVIDALSTLGVDGLAHRGTSDIAVDDRKIAGTALYRNKDVVFYHAIINVAGNVDLMGRYLKPPPRMPDYRRGRTHNNFVTSLEELGRRPTFRDFESALTDVWNRQHKNLRGD